MLGEDELPLENQQSETNKVQEYQSKLYESL